MYSVEEMNRMIDEVMKYSEGRRDKAHALYLYQCRVCHRITPIYLGVGVEGPDKEGGHWIASPFMGPECHKCHSDTCHNHWYADQHFDPPIDPPAGSLMFAVPDKGINPDHFGSVMFCGELRVMIRKTGAMGI